MPGLFAADGVELAARVFTVVFSGASIYQPVRELMAVDRCLSTLGGVPVGTGFLGLVSRTEWERLQPLSVEVTALWERALVAGTRTTGADYAQHRLVLMRRGATMLTVPDPVGFLREALGGPTASPLR